MFKHSPVLFAILLVALTTTSVFGQTATIDFVLALCSSFPTAYWAQSYVDSIEKDGKFEVNIKNPYHQGKLYLSFCFDNGIVTADTESAKIKKSAKVIAYSGKKGKREFRE